MRLRLAREWDLTNPLAVAGAALPMLGVFAGWVLSVWDRAFPIAPAGAAPTTLPEVPSVWSIVVSDVIAHPFAFAVVLIPAIALAFGNKWSQRRFDRTPDSQRRDIRALRRWAVSFTRRTNRVFGIVLLGGLATMLIVQWEVAIGLSAVIALLSFLPIITYGLLARRSSRLVCRRCDYPMVSWRAAGPSCPECGNAWKDPWNARVGARAINWRWVLLGIALGISGVGTLVFTFSTLLP